VNLNRRHLLALTALPILVAGLGCSGRDPTDLSVARAPSNPVVFAEGYDDDVYFQPFSGTYVHAASLDSVYAYNSQLSLKIDVPPQGSALGAYAGGVLTSVAVRDLTDFNALTFYARSSVNSILNTVGFGNDNTGFSLYDAVRSNVPLTTNWTFVVVPIPAPAKLIAERGLFTFAEGWEAAHPEGHQIWFDDIRYAHLGNITDPRPIMPSLSKQYFVGSTASIQGTYTLFNVDGANIRVDHYPSYFDFASSDPAVATVTGGQIKIVGVGNAVITATMDSIQVAGSVTLSGFEPPTVAPPPPTLPAQNVISMFSDVYRNVPIDSWNPHWQYSTTEDADYVVDGDNTKMYSNLNFVGIVFTTQTIDASGMTHFHLDVFAPAGTNFRVKVVAFNQDNGNSIGEAELTFDASTTPAFVAGEWCSLDIPLADFQLTALWDHIGQLVLSTDDARLVLVDNIYWHR
jgi:hypothetical protein